MKIAGLVFSFLVSGMILGSFYTTAYAHNFSQNQDSIFFTLVKRFEVEDIFSAFGIAITQDEHNDSTIFLSDHGSSRVIVSNLSSELKNYASYWTSPSQAYPASLPSQISADKVGNVYFAQHGGNKISKISADSGLMTEFDIPTGPLATVVYIAVAPDAAKVWFTEWTSNRIGYLDNSLPSPLDLKMQNDRYPSPITLRTNQTFPLDVMVTKDNNIPRPLSLYNIELSAIGMTDSGLQGVTYVAKPQRFNMNETSKINGSIGFNVNPDDAIAGKYTIMTRVSTMDRDNLTVSSLYPQMVVLDVPIHKSQLQNLPTTFDEQSSNPTSLLRDIARFASIGVEITLIAYLVYRKIGKRGENKRKRITQ